MIVKRLAIAVVLLSSLSMASVGYGADQPMDKVVSETAAYLQKAIPTPTAATIGGEWVIIGLARSSEAVPEAYFNGYYTRLEALLKEKKGVLHTRKHTEYARAVLALTAMGKDPRHVAGYDVLKPLGNFDQTVWQGINGSIFALLALDSGNYDVPICEDASKQATRQRYIDDILARQLPDGGFALSGKKTDPDVTAMVLQALAKYQDQPRVKMACRLAIATLSRMQNDDGGYASWGTINAESTAQVLMALCEMGISAEDPRFVKNGHTLVDNLLQYQVKSGGFKHLKRDQGANGMASEQVFYTLVNYQRILHKETSLYRMTDLADKAKKTA